MSSLMSAPSRRPFLPSRVERSASRELALLETRAELAMRSDALRIERAAEKTERGLIAVAHVSAVEAALLPMVPHAERRLQQVADGGALAIARIVMEP
jgi:hypothetical protein